MVITLLPTVDALVDVTRELARGASASTVVLEMSILPVAAKEQARDALAAVGAMMLDAPVSGTPSMVTAGLASVYRSGPPAPAATAILDAIAPVVHDVGDFGAGTQVKHIAHLLLAVHHLAAAEALSLATQAGMDCSRLLAVLGESPAASRALLLRGPQMAAGRFSPVTGTVGNLTEGLTQVQHFALATGAATPLLDTALAHYRAAATAGHEREDISVMVREIGRLERP